MSRYCFGPIPLRQQERMAAVLQQVHHLGLGDGPAEVRFLIRDLRQDVVLQLVDDVVLILRRQIALDLLQIPIDEIHGYS